MPLQLSVQQIPVVLCDPAKITPVGWVPGNNVPGPVAVPAVTMQLAVRGRWSYAPSHFCGPAGDPNNIMSGINRGAVVIQLWQFTSILSRPAITERAYDGNPLSISGAGVFALAVFIRMNDDNHDDNSNDPDDPMKASLIPAP